MQDINNYTQSIVDLENIFKFTLNDLTHGLK